MQVIIKPLTLKSIEWKKKSEEKGKNNKIYHRGGDRPAVIDFRKNADGKVEMEYMCWYRNGKKHREGDKPAQINYYSNGTKIFEWFKDGKLHRDFDQPAHISYHVNGNIEQKIWYRNGKIARDFDLPAYEIYYPNGNLKEQIWYQAHSFFRLGLDENFNPKPFCVKYEDNGNIIPTVFPYRLYHRVISRKTILKCIFLFKRFVFRYKNKKQTEIRDLIFNTKFCDIQGSDISRMIPRFVY